MTTVAVKAGVFAADTQLSSGGTINRVTKLFRLRDGGVAAGAGQWNVAYAALRWLAEGEQGDCPEFEGATLLIGRPDGSLWMADDKWPAYPLLDKVASIGCASQAAQALMAKGKSARQAVDACITQDPHTSAPVQVMKVKRK